MIKLTIAHWEITRGLLYKTGDFLKKQGLPIYEVPRQKEIFATFAAEYADGILREISKWLPSPMVESGYLNLMRLIPELRVISDSDIFSDYYSEVLDPYRQQLHDTLVAATVDWQWAEYRIVKFDERTMTIEYIGDRRVLEWERANKDKDVAYKRAQYAACKATIRYPNGFLRD